MAFSEKVQAVFSPKLKSGYPKIKHSCANTVMEDGASSSDKTITEAIFPFPGTKPSIWRRYRNLIIVHLALFSLYGITIYLVATQHEPKFSRKYGLPFSPAIEALQYEEHTFSLEDRIQEKGSYSGLPNPDLDKVWHDLLDPENIRLEPEIMKHYDRLDSGVVIPEGGGYIGTLNVYHEIHCLKRIKQYMYPEYYFPNISAADHEMNRMHNEHCIDFLRQASMCHGDIGLITFEWKPQSRIPVAKATTHQCVNWQQIEDWTKARTVDMMKPGWLVHPTLGIAYPDGKGDKIGGVKIPDPGQQREDHTTPVIGQEKHEHAGSNADEAHGY